MRKPKWQTVEQIVTALHDGTARLANIENLYYAAIRNNYPERLELFKNALEQYKKEKK
ncbi:hypothetical protein BN1200_490028 [Klebsiella variicola]|uniref:hypothetical protein n=1 Tax=Klebsiella variicola TaxID=244366 RepID=UPI000671DAF6|nr:hypothetical protein [Klebsiella variicola]CTQ13937.1 hypothetical protein BN1200_490028 [Klebsiella variicola]